MGQCQRCINFSTLERNSLVHPFQALFEVNSKEIGVRGFLFFQFGMNSGYHDFNVASLEYKEN